MEKNTARFWFARVVAPLVFFAAATLLVLLVRESFDSGPAGSESSLQLIDGGDDSVVVTTTLTKEEEVPNAKDVASEESPGVVSEECVPPERSTYVIKNGDTLESIAEKVCTTVDKLKELNPDVDAVALQKGQRLRIKPQADQENE